MVQSLEEFTAQANQAYLPSQQAIQNQLGALDAQLNTANERINRNYAQQQSQLESQRNQAAEAASLQAAGSGGSFGGAANIANRKYYEQSFVPAQTQLQTNQANELASARQDYENQRTNLNAQLANLQAQANQQALQQYWAAVEAEKQREAQRAAARASAAAQNASAQQIMDAIRANQSQGVRDWDFGGGYHLVDNNGEAKYYKDGAGWLTAGQFLNGTGANGAKWDIWKDVWANGVSTRGVGSDTVSAFNRKSPTDSKYSYLF